MKIDYDTLTKEAEEKYKVLGIVKGIVTILLGVLFTYLHLIYNLGVEVTELTFMENLVTLLIGSYLGLLLLLVIHYFVYERKVSKYREHLLETRFKQIFNKD